MGLGFREYGFPTPDIPVPLIIVWSVECDTTSSLPFSGYNWMKSIKKVIKDRQLRHLVVPGAHDAAMNITNTKPWGGGRITENTDTQSLDHYNQLRVDVRYSDMRIVSIWYNDGMLYAAHISEDNSELPAGAIGTSLYDLISGINRFTTDDPGEVIVWWIRYLVTLGGGLNSWYWDEATTSIFFDKLEGINNRRPDIIDNPTNKNIDQIPVGKLMEMDGGTGCVLLFTEQSYQKATRNPNPSGRTKSGIYRENLNRRDFWAEKEFVKYRNANGSTNDQGWRKVLHHAVAGYPLSAICYNGWPSRSQTRRFTVTASTT